MTRRDDLDPARGVVLGLHIALLFWAAVAAACVCVWLRWHGGA